MEQELYERILDLRNRISLDGDDTIYEEDYLLLDEVLDLVENIDGEDTDIETQIYDYNNTVDIYNELEIGIKFKKQEQLLNKIKDIINKPDDSYVSSMLEESKRYVEIVKLIKENENETN